MTYRPPDRTDAITTEMLMFFGDDSTARYTLYLLLGSPCIETRARVMRLLLLHARPLLIDLASAYLFDTAVHCTDKPDLLRCITRDLSLSLPRHVVPSGLALRALMEDRIYAVMDEEFDKVEPSPVTVCIVPPRVPGMDVLRSTAGYDPGELLHVLRGLLATHYDVLLSMMRWLDDGEALAPRLVPSPLQRGRRYADARVALEHAVLDVIERDLATRVTPPLSLWVD